MAHVHPVATMCEVTYDSDWYEDDRYMTPYRYSLLRNDTDSNSDTVSLTLPSYTYYEYLRSLYDCRSTALHRHPPGYPVSPGSDRIPERAKTWHEFGSERTSVQASREAAHSEPTKIRPTYPFPSLHLIQQGATSGDESDEDDFWDRSKEKLVWVDALNKWIPEQQLHHRPYLSFVGNPPTVEKQGLPKSTRETPGGGDFIEIPYCERFEQHMGRASVSQRSQASRQRTNDNKREEIRRRAQEIAEQRRQRKAYSTPLYTSLTERKQKARIQSCKAPASTPVSPVQKTVKAPLPKEVWQSRDTPKPEEKTVPLKKEISIRLLSPKAEDVDSKASGDLQPTPRDKRVKFQQDKTAKDKQSKTETNEENKNNNARSDSAAAERKLVEALEKQRQQQLAEEQRLLQEQQREKERLARERETQAEKERLEKERERLLELEKDPKKHGLMNSHKQPHENYYESTMNAAGYYKKAEDKSDIRNRNLNKGVLKPKEPVKAFVPHNKIEKDNNRDNLARNKKMGDNVDSQKPVPGGMNYVPSKENKIKKDKPKQVEVMVENKEPENSLIDVGGKRRKGKDGARTQKKKGTKVKKKGEDEDEEKHQEKLQVSSADDLIQEEEPPEPTEEKPKTKIKVKQQPVEDNTPQNPEENGLAYERRKSISQRVKEISLKEKRERPCVKKESKEEKEETLPLPPDSKKVESWIFDDENFSEPVETKQEEEETVDFVAPAISADLTPELVIEEKTEKKEKRRTSLIEQKIKTENKGKKWGKPKKDTSYEDELRRQEIAEERRRRQMEMLERLKGRQMEQFEGQEDDGSPHFEDYGFLSKYCIFTKGNIEMYRHAFDAVDDQHRGWLEGEEVMIALRGVNSKLTEAEEEYMYRILELTGYKLTNGADFKMFSVLAALSQRISALDSWMRNLIGKMDFKMLDMKLFMCKTLWECNVDHDTNKISIDQLCVDLRAGGVSLEHEFEVRNKLSHLDALDLLDFLTYVPLFIMIHESVVENPLSDIREK